MSAAPSGNYDAIIVGGGPIGAHVAKELIAQKKRVLMLEAGRAGGLTYQSYRSYVDNYYTQVVKDTNSPYPYNASAPSPNDSDILKIVKGTPDIVGYQVEMGPEAFGSTYLRQLGGTSLHWLGTTPRFCPNDFQLQTKYGKRHRLAADVRGSGAVLRRGGMVDRRGGQQDGSGDARDHLPRRIRLSDGAHPAELQRRRHREGGEGEDGHLRRQEVPDRSHQPRPGAQLDPAEGLHPGGRGRQSGARPALRGQRGVHPDLSRAGEVQRAQDDRHADRFALLHADHAGGRDEGDARPERARQRRRVRAVRGGGGSGRTRRSPRRRRSTYSPATRWRTRSCSSRRTSPTSTTTRSATT